MVPSGVIIFVFKYLALYVMFSLNMIQTSTFFSVLIHNISSYMCVCVYVYGNPLQYSCRRILWTEEPGGLQFMGSQRDMAEVTDCVCVCIYICVCVCMQVV